MTNSLQEMAARREAWMNEKPTYTGNTLLRPRGGDLIWFQFASTGNDGDQFFKVYKAHEFPILTPAGRNTAYRFCPVKNGDSNECPYCAQGHVAIKERMSMWVWVQLILHTGLPQKMPEGVTFPIVTHEGRNYYQEALETDVGGQKWPGGFRIWHASAWRESPFDDIVRFNSMFSGLHNFSAQLIATGEGMARRYKMYALPNTTGFNADQYAVAKELCKAIPQLLLEEMASPVTVAPPENQAQPINFATLSLPPTNVAATPATIPGMTVPQATVPSAVVVAPPPAAAPVEVAAVPAAVVVEPTVETPVVADLTAEAPVVEAPAAIQEDTRRPLNKLF